MKGGSISAPTRSLHTNSSAHSSRPVQLLLLPSSAPARPPTPAARRRPCLPTPDLEPTTSLADRHGPAGREAAPLRGHTRSPERAQPPARPRQRAPPPLALPRQRPAVRLQLDRTRTSELARLGAVRVVYRCSDGGRSRWRRRRDQGPARARRARRLARLEDGRRAPVDERAQRVVRRQRRDGTVRRAPEGRRARWSSSSGGRSRVSRTRRARRRERQLGDDVDAVSATRRAALHRACASERRARRTAGAALAPHELEQQRRGLLERDDGRARR